MPRSFTLKKTLNQRANNYATRAMKKYVIDAELDTTARVEVWAMLSTAWLDGHRAGHKVKHGE